MVAYQVQSYEKAGKAGSRAKHFFFPRGDAGRGLLVPLPPGRRRPFPPRAPRGAQHLGPREFGRASPNMSAVMGGERKKRRNFDTRKKHITT